MATKRGPTKGSRILVKLPFGRAKTGGVHKASQYISIKQGVATILGFKPVTNVPTQKVKYKTAKGTATVTRRIEGSYRQRSVRLIFSAPKSIKGSKGTFKSVSMPVPSGVTLDDIVKYFHVGAGKSKGVIGMITPAGKRVQWAEAKL